MSRHTQGVGLALILILTAACGSTMMGPRQGEVAEIAEMKSRILELQRQATVAEVELERLRRQVAELESEHRARITADPQTGRAGAAPAEARPPAEAGSADSVEEADLAPISVDAPPAKAVATPPPAAAPAPELPPVAPAPAPSAATARVTAEAQALYDAGYTLYHQGRYLDAESSFQRFLQTHAATSLGDNAQFWIGESRYARGDIKGALAAFRETLDRYPSGNKVPDALLKIGDCLAGLGDVDGARGSYGDVIERFPESVAAAIAEERRAALP